MEWAPSVKGKVDNSEYFVFLFCQKHSLSSHVKVLSFLLQLSAINKWKMYVIKTGERYIYFSFSKKGVRTLACFSIDLYVTADFMIMRVFKIWTYVISNQKCMSLITYKTVNSLLIRILSPSTCSVINCKINDSEIYCTVTWRFIFQVKATVKHQVTW